MSDCLRRSVCGGGGQPGERTDKALHAVGHIRRFVTAHEHELRVFIQTEWLLVDRGSRGGTESIGAGAGSGNSARDDMRSLRNHWHAAIGIADIHVVAKTREYT